MIHLFHVKLLQAKNGCKTKVAFILKYRTAKCMCQPKLAGRKKRIPCQNNLPAKIGCQSRMDAIPKRAKWLVSERSCQNCVPEKVYTSQKCGKTFSPLLIMCKIFQENWDCFSKHKMSKRSIKLCHFCGINRKTSWNNLKKSRISIKESFILTLLFLLVFPDVLKIFPQKWQYVFHNFYFKMEK